MPVFKFRLTDTETGESRSVSVSADTKEEAEQVIYQQEMKKTLFSLDQGAVTDLEKKLKDGSLSGVEKARLFAHRQEKPYTIQKAKEAS
jgi:hypothetical protein